ncbi:MAG TPA: class I SAM-dependent methyltransferase [Nitrolancea sp.]|jgi:SAM-dependent methyltransferase|nr:class I SAM-dependent methyltransferase [Nitrolancea sp.]
MQNRSNSDNHFSLEASYDEYPRIEEEFQAVLDLSLKPSGPELLYEVVGELQLPGGAAVIDVGCGEGKHALALATRFGFAVHGIDPVPRHIDLSDARLAEAASAQPELSQRVHFEPGTAEKIPAEDGSCDLVWCRDVLVHVADLDQVYAEFRRVLKETGHALVYQMFGTDRIEPREAAWLWATMGVVPESASPERTEEAIANAGLRVDSCVDVGSAWGEFTEEQSGDGTRQLLHAARLIRSPGQYIAQFGQAAYDLMLGDCLWHVYRMLGKLSGRIYLLSKQSDAG